MFRFSPHISEHGSGLDREESRLEHHRKRLRQTLNSDLTQYPAYAQLQVLLHGMHLDSGDGRMVAQHFQTFILTSRRFDNP